MILDFSPSGNLFVSGSIFLAVFKFSLHLQWPFSFSLFPAHTQFLLLCVFLNPLYPQFVSLWCFKLSSSSFLLTVFMLSSAVLSVLTLCSLPSLVPWVNGLVALLKQMSIRVEWEDGGQTASKKRQRGSELPMRRLNSQQWWLCSDILHRGFCKMRYWIVNPALLSSESNCSQF